MPSKFKILVAWVWFLVYLGCSITDAFGQSEGRPNILWITCEDTGPQLGCYGDSYATTPNLDRFAEKSLRFTRCWSNAPVCAPARTTLITGLYPTSYGAQHMRSSVDLPKGASTLPSLLRQAGYYCSNNNKEDYNFPRPEGMWDDSSNKAHWRNRKPDQPFFSVFNTTVTHESQIRKRPYSPKHDPKLAPIPPYHPDHPEVRLDWAQYYDRITEMDAFVGRKLEELKDAGLADSTIVFFFGDHGCGLPRGKRWLYQSGLHVPMIVHIPKKFSGRFDSIYQQGATSDRLVAFVDLLPTVLDLCQVPIPEGLHGRSFFVSEEQVNVYNYGFRDRMDERVDSSRAIRNDRFLYIRNFMPDRPQGAYLNYMFQTPTTQVWERQYLTMELNELQRAFWIPKAVEELYEIQSDPHQVRNLANDPGYHGIRNELAEALKAKMMQLGDTGAIPEDWIRSKVHQDMGIAIEAAWRSGQAIDDGELLAQMLASSQVIERYWGAVALRTGGEARRNRRNWELAEGLLNDPSLHVRAVVAESLARYSDQPESRLRALDILLKIPVQSDAPWGARILALNGLSDLRSVNQEQVSLIKDAFLRDGKSWSDGLPNRYSEYLGRLVEALDSR
jgi:uncharacterized sulfatase